MSKIKILYTIIFIAVCISVASGIYYFYQDMQRTQKVFKITTASNIAKDIPWDLELLSHPPKVKWINRNGKIKSLYYEGLPYKGEKTFVFAYYATPGSISGDETKDHGLPGIVVVHGGMGAASEQFVELWAKRGYAALSMDLEGRGPNRERLKNGGPPSYEYMNYDWNYHAIAKIILAHSLMLSFKEIDINRTGIAGVSVGGHLTCVVAGLDNRFKAAASIYGCGFLYENGFFNEWYDTKLTKEEQEIWKKSLDPSNYLGNVTIPFLFASSTNDRFYPIDILSESYKLLKSQCYLSIDPTFKHSEKGMALYLVGFFFDQYLKGASPLPVIKKPKIIGGKLYSEAFNVKPKSHAWLLYTTDKGSFLQRKWRIKSAKIAEKGIVADKPPDNTTICFFDYLLDGHSIISSEALFMK